MLAIRLAFANGRIYRGFSSWCAQWSSWLLRACFRNLAPAPQHNQIANREIILDVLLMLKFMIGVGVVFTVAIWIFYLWFKRQKNLKDECTNRKLDIY
jgi:hypothetical protein